MSSTNKERRKETRVNVQFAAWVIWMNDSGGEITEGVFTLNVSDSGVGLKMRRNLSEGKRVKITINTGGLSGSSFAEVRWTQKTVGGYRMGVSFKSDVARANG
jgi:hypothetical protein